MGVFISQLLVLLPPIASIPSIPLISMLLERKRRERET